MDIHNSCLKVGLEASLARLPCLHQKRSYDLAPAGSTAAPSQSVASRIASGRSRSKMEARGTAADIRSFRLRSYLVRGGVTVTVTVTVKSEGVG